MYSVTVRDHLMIAHSFRGDIFGPAQKLHGATYTVDVSFERAALDEHNLVVDVGLAGEVLAEVLSEFNTQNLDELENFRGHNTTAEFLARVIFLRMADAIRAGRLGESAMVLEGMKITLGESHIAWASYYGKL